MADILNENFTFLIDIISENSKLFDDAPKHLLLHQLNLVKGVRNPEPTDKTLIDLIVNSEVDNPPQVEKESVELPFIKVMHTIEKDVTTEEKE